MTRGGGKRKSLRGRKWQPVGPPLDSPWISDQSPKYPIEKGTEHLPLYGMFRHSP